MKLRTLILAVGLVTGLFASVALANGNGDVTIRVNGVAPGQPDPMGWIIPGLTSEVQIWITNDAPLYGMSMAFALSMDGFNFRLVPYEHLPPGQTYVEEWGSAVGKFDPNGLQVTYDSVAHLLLIQGTAVSNPLPEHATSTLCYSFQVHGLCGSSDSGGFYVDNIYVPPSGTWMFDDGTPYPPTFLAMPNTSITAPDAPAAQFYANLIPGIFPVFIAVPDSTETADHCSGFEFTFAAVDLNIPVFSLTYTANVGEMNPTTGHFVLHPESTCPSTHVIATVTSAACLSTNYEFTVNGTDTPPIFTNCPIVTGYIDTSEIYEYPLTSYDPDPCDTVTYSVVAHGNPYGIYSIDPTGKFVYVPTIDDYERLYVFDVLANSGCNSVDSCQVRVAVLRSTCGDANGDMTTDVGDVVSLISYIFQNGLPPNPPSNGDVNCSGSVDISDIVYMIEFIFAFGDPLCQCDK